MINNDICEMTGSQQAQLIREKQLSSKEVVQAVLERIQKVNPLLNAYCTLSDHALADAEQRDQLLSKGELLGPLHGVPVSVKDLIETKDLRTTFGSSLYSEYVPKQDDVVVERLRKAGAIIIGKTNVPEFGYNGITNNAVFGESRNPWDLDKTPGGSSGGSGAATAAGLGSLSLGSDGGGSVRIPSSFCGIYGIKPSFGRVPLFPGCRVPAYPGASSWESLECIGPMTRTVEDSALLLNIMTGEDIRDRHSIPTTINDFISTLNGSIRNLKIAWSPDWGYAQVDSEIREITKKAAKVFENELGCTVVEEHPGFDDIGASFWATVASDTDLESLRAIHKQQPETLSQSLVSLIETEWTAEDFTNAKRERQRIYNTMHDFMNGYDLILTPTVPCSAFDLGKEMPEKIGNKNNPEPVDLLAFTCPFNMTGQPAASVPVGFTDAGLPVGLQIVGRRLDEATVLKASAAFERVRPWVKITPSH